MNTHPATAAEFQAELDAIFKEAQHKSLSHVDVVSGDLHRRVGGYPGRNHRMPVCCRVMRHNIQTGDTVLHEPLRRNGATVKIRYKIPR